MGSNVVAKGEGAIDLAGLTRDIVNGSEASFIWPARGIIVTGPINSSDADVYIGFTGPASFGSGNNAPNADSGGGDIVGIEGFFKDLFVPAGYELGKPLLNTATYLNQSFLSLGVTPGTYEWIWGTGENQNFTLHYRRSRCRYPRTRQRLAARDGARRSVCWRAHAAASPRRERPTEYRCHAQRGNGGSTMFVKRVAGAAVLGAALLFGFSPLAPQAQAGYVVTLQQQGGQIIQTPTGPIEVGSAVIAKGGGAIDLTDLTKLDTGQIEQTVSAIAPVHGAISTGPTNPQEVDVYTELLGATDFGSTGPVNADSGEGDIAGIIGFSGVLLVPHGYISGTPLSDTATYLDRTFLTLGAIPGIYEWEWGGRAGPELHADHRRSRCRDPRAGQPLAARGDARRAATGAPTPPTQGMRGAQGSAAGAATEQGTA